MVLVCLSRLAGWLSGSPLNVRLSLADIQCEWLAGRIETTIGLMDAGSDDSIGLAGPPVMVDGIVAPPLQMDGIWSLVEYLRVSECIFGSRRRRRTGRCLLVNFSLVSSRV
jgi:hypothetical protein